MSDFRIQYVSGTVPSGTTQLILTAPTSFEAIGSLSSAFIMPTGNMQTVGLGGVGGSTELRDWCLNCDINSTTQIILNRGDSNGAVEFAFYIVEYTGVAGGPNEFIMRTKRIFPFSPAGATLTSHPTAVTGFTTLSRCVPFANGRHDGTGTAALRHFMAQAYLTSQGADAVLSLERNLGSNGEPTYVVYVVEFTGSNWSVQQGLINNWTANTNKDTAITAVTLARAWLYGHYVPGNRDTPAGATWFGWLPATTILRTRTIEVSTLSSLRYWIIQNSASSFGVQVANAVNGTNDWLAGTSPQTQLVTISPTPSAGVMITGWAGSSSVNTNQQPAGVWRFRQTSLTQAQAYRTRSSGNTEYIIQTVSFPADVTPSLILAPAPGQMALTGQQVNTPFPVNPGVAALQLQPFPPFSQLSREPLTAVLSLNGRQPLVAAFFPPTITLTLAGLQPTLGLEKVLDIPMPALNYDAIPTNAPTVIVGGISAPTAATLTIQVLPQFVGEGGNIVILSPPVASLLLGGLLGVVGVEQAAPGALSTMGLAPDLTNRETVLEPEVGSLLFDVSPVGAGATVSIPYQWIDVDPAPVVEWR